MVVSCRLLLPSLVFVLVIGTAVNSFLAFQLPSLPGRAILLAQRSANNQHSDGSSTESNRPRLRLSALSPGSIARQARSHGIQDTICDGCDACFDAAHANMLSAFRWRLQMAFLCHWCALFAMHGHDHCRVCVCDYALGYWQHDISVQLGFGTAGMGEHTAQAVVWALEAGYRLLDSAQACVGRVCICCDRSQSKMADG